MKINLKYIISGTGRCGTVYMARFFTDIGINCGHEAIFDYNGLDLALKKINGNALIETSHCSRFDLLKSKPIENWFSANNIMAESSYMAAPFLNNSCFSDARLIHIIRNPLKVLSSFFLDAKFFDPKSEGQKPWNSFVYKHMPSIEMEKSIVEKTCRYIIDWNRMIEKSKIEKIKIRIEDYPYDSLAKFLRSNAKIIKNNKINSWKNREKELTIFDIPKGKTRDEFVFFMKENKYSVDMTII